MLHRTALLLVIAIVVSAAVVQLGGARVSAQAPEPTSTRVAHPAIIIHVINDLNGDGIRQSSEPGLSGWNAYAGCSDAILQLGPTDGNGEFRWNAPFDQCFRLERQFGWLPTSPISVVARGAPGATVDIAFLVRDMGRNATEIGGEVIVAGLPAQSAKLTVAAPFASCGAAFLEPGTAFSRRTMIVSGADFRSGCPAVGQPVTIPVDGAPARTLPFALGQSQSTTFVVGGDSMRVFTTDADAARIDGKDCAVVIPLEGFALIPPGSVRIFVMSEEVRPGCGAPGRLVRFVLHDTPLDPLVPWRAGNVDERIDFTPASLATPTASATPTPRSRVIAPDTGTGPSADGGTTPTWPIVALALLCAGTVCTAIMIRRRTPR